MVFTGPTDSYALHLLVKINYCELYPALLESVQNLFSFTAREIKMHMLVFIARGVWYLGMIK